MLISDDMSLSWENSRGGQMILAPYTEYFLTECSDSLENTINSDKQGNLDGETFISSSLAIRHFEIKGFLNTAARGAAMKRMIERTFNATLPGTLTYANTRTNTVRRIDCMVENLPVVKNEGNDITFNIQLAALKSLWYGSGMSGSISTINKTGHFPVVIPPAGFLFGYRINIFENKIENVGDTACGVTFRLTARLGTVTNPVITHKDSGSVIKIMYKMNQDDYFDVISMPDKAQILLNGTTDAMQYLTDEARRRFFLLYVGVNTIGYGADENVANLDVKYSCTDLYLGV